MWTFNQGINICLNYQNGIQNTAYIISVRILASLKFILMLTELVIGKAEKISEVDLILLHLSVMKRHGNNCEIDFETSIIEISLI